MSVSGLLRDRSLGLKPMWHLPSVVTSRRMLSLEINSKQEIHEYFTGDVNSLDIEKHDGKYLLAGGSDASVALFDLEKCESRGSSDMKICELVSSTTGKSSRAAHQYSVETVTWFPHDTGMFMTSGMDHRLKIWDTNAWVVAEEFEFDSPIYNHAVSAGSSHSLVAVGRKEHNVKLCDMETGSTTQILRGHSGPVLSLAWSPHNDFHLVSGSLDSKMLMWDIRRAKSLLCAFDMHNGRQQLTFEGKLAHQGFVNSVQFTSDGQKVVSLGTDRHLRVWDAFTGENTLVNFGSVPCRSRRSIQLALVDGDSRQQLVFVPASKDVKCYDITTGRELKTLIGHFGVCGACVRRPQRQELLSGAKDNRVLWWSPPSPKPLQCAFDVRTAPNFGGLLEEAAAEVSAALQDAWSSDEGGT